MTNDSAHPTFSDAVAARMIELRKRAGMTREQLAERCAADYSQDEHGMPCRCGRSYDDVDRSTRWPHNVLPPAGERVVVTLGTPEAGALLARMVAQLRGEVTS